MPNTLSDRLREISIANAPWQPGIGDTIDTTWTVLRRWFQHLQYAASSL